MIQINFDADITVRARVGGERRRVRVPGGWSVRAPSYDVDEESLRHFAAYWAQDVGPGNAAWKAAAKSLLAPAYAGWRKAVYDYVRRRLREYAERWPEHVQSDGCLRGFDPVALVERGFMPHENSGRAGKLFVRSMLREMAEGVDIQSPIV